MARYKAGFLRGEQDESRCKFGGLASAFQGGLFAEGGKFFLGLTTADLQGGPNRAGCHGIHSDTSISELLGERLCEVGIHGLGRGVIEEIRRGVHRLLRSGEDDAGTGLEMGHRRFGDPERCIAIGLVSGIEVFGGEVENGVPRLLSGGVVYQNVESAQ